MQRHGRSIQALLTQNMIETPKYSGKLCPGAKKRLTKAIEFMVMQSEKRSKEKIYNPVTHRLQPFRIGFLTLTIYSTNRNITGKEAHKTCLEPFLKFLRQTTGVKSYIWKAELQKRGQIHYHLTIDAFVHWKKIQDKWNQLQKRAGYLDAYYHKYGHWQPNSIKIHSTKKIRNIGVYLTKEIAKTFQNEKSLGGKVWDCSKNLKALKYFVVHESLDYSFINQMVKEKKMTCIETDHCYIYQTAPPAYEFLSEENKQLYKQHIYNEEPKRKPVNETIATLGYFSVILNLMNGFDFKSIDVGCNLFTKSSCFIDRSLCENFDFSAN